VKALVAFATVLFAGGVALADAPKPPPEAGGDPLAAYYAQLEQMHLIDVESGTLDSLRKELGRAEDMLRAQSFDAAAVALYAIVKSPRYSSFTEFVEFQNAEYDLGVALARAGAYGASLDAFDACLKRGPNAAYWGPAHRRVVDIALETRDHAGVLARLESFKYEIPIPPSAAGERAYLRGRAAYDHDQLADAEAELVTVSKKSRLYSSAVYLRGVIWARRGDFKASATAMCEIAGTSDTDKLTFVVDDRYFTLKDLARLGLGRIAHENGEYDDAYYHYFQIPDDSPALPEALFEASWSMYQKRELATSRDLVHEFLKNFPSSPEWPEASLLAGYVELADCKFDASQKWYDELTVKLQPIVDEIDSIRKQPALRKELFATAVQRYRATKTDTVADAKAAKVVPLTKTEQVVALLTLDPKFIRLNDALTGMRTVANAAPANTRAWQDLARQVNETRVGKVAADRSTEEEQLADANAVSEQLRRLVGDIAAQEQEIARAMHDGTLDPNDGKAELERLGKLHERALTAATNAVAAQDKAAEAVTSQAAPTLRPLIQADLADARRLDKQAKDLEGKLEVAGEKLAQQSIDRLYKDTRRVLDKAKLGKVDAVIGQKRKLDIEVQDLASGRFPEELIGRMWNASMIGDDEEFWPWQGEYWSDEYEGWR
jgi:TolA-binding protein